MITKPKPAAAGTTFQVEDQQTIVTDVDTGAKPVLYTHDKKPIYRRIGFK